MARAIAAALAAIAVDGGTLTAQPATIASPTVTHAAGAVTITYGNVTINRPQRSDGPTIAQIYAAVQHVIDHEVARSSEELQLEIEAQLDALDRITQELGQLRHQVAALRTVSDDNHAVLAKKLASIAELVERGRMDEARTRLDDLYDLGKPGRHMTLRTLVETSLTGYRARIATAAFLRSYDLAVWPANVGAKSFSVGFGGAIGTGAAEGGYASPSPDRRLVTPVSFSSYHAVALGAASLALWRARSLSVLTTLELEFGLREYDSDHSDSHFMGVAVSRLSIGGATSISRVVFATLSMSVAYEPWARRPVYFYTGVGAAHMESASFGGMYAGIALSLNLRK
jgi:hypothetical protein